MRAWGYVLAVLFLAFFSFGGCPLTRDNLFTPLWGFAVGVLILTRGFQMQRWVMRKAYPFTLASVALGILIRYAVEYGEHSWKLAFTGRNVLVYLLAMPAYVMLICRLLRRLEQSGWNKKQNTVD